MNIKQMNTLLTWWKRVNERFNTESTLMMYDSSLDLLAFDLKNGECLPFEIDVNGKFSFWGDDWETFEAVSI